MLTFKSKDKSGEIINSALSAFTFPAGEAHIKRNYSKHLQPVEIAIFQPDAETLHDDLFHLAMWADYLAGEAYYDSADFDTPLNIASVLIMPYMPGARADRGLPFGLDVYATFINEMAIDQIIVFDPHSEATTVKLKGWHNTEFVYPKEFFEQEYVQSMIGAEGYDGIIAPDKGALLRAEGVAQALGLPVFTATKERNEETGKLSNFKIEGLDPDGFYLVVDDICDAGGTFKGLAKASGLDWGHLDLYVSHGVFSKDALDTLGEFFENIYTTNSYNPQRLLEPSFLQEDPEPEQYHGFKRFDVIRLLESKIKY